MNLEDQRYTIMSRVLVMYPMLFHHHGQQFLRLRHFHFSSRMAHHRRTTIIDIASRILYEDNHILVINKPSGTLVQGGGNDHHHHRLPSLHSSSSNDQNNNNNNNDPNNLLDEIKSYLIQRDNKTGQAWLGLVHRLDRPTSGDTYTPLFLHISTNLW